MSRWTIELDGGAHFELDARSERDARYQAHQQQVRGIIEIRPFAAKGRAVRVDKMPAIPVRPDPFAVLAQLQAKEENHG